VPNEVHTTEHVRERGECDIGWFRVVQGAALTQSRCPPEMVVVSVAYIFDPGRRDGRETVRETCEHIACIPLGVPLGTEVALGAAGKLKAAGQGNVVTELPPCLAHQPDACRGVRVEFFRRDGLAR